MDWPPLSSVIEIESKLYSVETAPSAETRRFHSVIKLGGRLLSSREKDPGDGLEGEALRQSFLEFHRGRMVELESVFRLAKKIEDRPTADACNKIGVILLANGFLDDARAKFTRSLELESDKVSALKNLGITLFLLGDFEAATAAFHKAKEVGPGFADIYYHLGNVHLAQLQLDAATPCYLQALSINPRYADARLKLGAACVGYLLQAGKDLPEAKAKELEARAASETETAAKLNPKIRNREYLLAQDFLKVRRFDMAFQHLLEVRPKYVPRVGDEVVFFFSLTLLYGSEGIDVAMTDRYIDKLAAVIEEYPQYADLHQHLGTAFLIRSRFVVARAAKELKRSLEINPQMPRGAESLAEVEELHRRVLAALKKALVLS